MRLLQNTQNNLVRRLLAITILTIATNAILTLIAQPASYWRSPGTAIRFDGLTIHSSTNPMFDFFLGRGWLAYLTCVALLAAVVWLIVAALPKRLALVAEFTVILGLCYCGSNWIVVRCNTGTTGAWLCVAFVAFLLAAAVLPSLDLADNHELTRLCWLMALATAIDAAFTLIGQPATYWQNTATVHEGNPIARHFLEIGWWAYLSYILVWIAIPWLIALRASRLTGWTIVFAFTLGGLFGGSNWLFYVWRLGLQAPILYALLLSILIGQLVLKRDHRTPSNARSSDPAPLPPSHRTANPEPRGVFDCC